MAGQSAHIRSLTGAQSKLMYWPGEHVMHGMGADRPSVLQWCPAGQLVDAMAVSQYHPTGHAPAEVDPSGQSWPGTHGRAVVGVLQ